MKIDLNSLSLVLADKNNEIHKKGVFKVFNENIEYFFLTSKPISYEQHSKWWNTIFNKEIIYIIIYQSNVCGYIRLTKERTNTKGKNEISIAILKEYQNASIGTFAYKLFEEEMKKRGISEIIAITNIKNTLGQKFFEKNNFRKSLIKYIKKL